MIGNALELRAFDRMEEDIRLVGYFKSEESEREWGPSSPFTATGRRLNGLKSADLQLRF